MVEPQHHALLKKLAHRHEMTQAGVFVIAIEAMARSEGMRKVKGEWK